MRLLVILSVFLWIGCQPIETQTNSTDKYFDLPHFSQELLKAQINTKSKVVKITQVNKVEEKNNINKADSAFWATELSPLLNEELNRPSLIDAYSIQNDIPEQTSNLLKTVYTALPNTHTDIKWLEIKYLDTPKNIRQITARFRSENSVYTTEQVVNLWVNKYGNLLLIDSINTQGYNKTILLDSMKYCSKVVVIR